MARTNGGVVGKTNRPSTFNAPGVWAKTAPYEARTSGDWPFATSNQYVAVAHATTPYIAVYPWYDVGGFGTKISDPATLPAGTGNQVKFSKTGEDIAIAHTSSPYISAYPWSSAGFGTKYSNPATLQYGTQSTVAFNNASNMLAAGGIATSALKNVGVYPWTPGTGFGTRFSTPSDAYASSTIETNEVVFSPNDSDIIYSSGTSTARIHAFQWSNSTGWGSKYNDPPTGSGTGEGCDINASGNVVTLTTGSTPYVFAWPWTSGATGGSGFGTAYSNPSTLPTGTRNCAKFSPAENAVAYLTSIWNVYAWDNTTGYGSLYTEPATQVGTAYDAAWNSTSTVMFEAHTTTPFINAWPFTAGSGFGTAYSNPSTLPASTGNGVHFIQVAA